MFKKRFGDTSSCNAATTSSGGKTEGCGGSGGCDGGSAPVQEKPPSPKTKKELLARVSDCVFFASFADSLVCVLTVLLSYSCISFAYSILCKLHCLTG